MRNLWILPDYISRVGTSNDILVPKRTQIISNEAHFNVCKVFCVSEWHCLDRVAVFGFVARCSLHFR